MRETKIGSDCLVAVARDSWAPSARSQHLFGRALRPFGSILSLSLPDSRNSPATYVGLETSATLRPRLNRFTTITDDHMGAKRGPDELVPWHDVP
jgi:hypothetical protein